MKILELLATCRAAISVASAFNKLTKRMKRKTNQFSLRLDEDLAASVEECCKQTGIEPAHFIKEAFKAFVEEVRRTGEIRMPLALVPKMSLIKTPFRSTVVPQSQDAAISSRLNEEPATPRSTAVPTSEKPLTKTRAGMRKIAKDKTPQL